MFTITPPKSKTEKLISILTPKYMSQYIDDLTDLLNDIVHNISKEKYMKLFHSLCQIKDEILVLGY
ncbi:hypothetical protein COL33_21945 [Bacillus toyonensis]|nr:hypothetical protein COL33_21945 [Bacillus toyonensis]PGC01171.1 hypothetical protein COM20_26775 [Bacillus toyonensis]